MKNFTKQITNKTLFKPTRWLLMALMLLLGTSGAWGADYWVIGPAVGGWDQWEKMDKQSDTRYTYSVNSGEFKITKANNWDNSNRLDNIGCNDNNDTYKGNVTCNGANNHYANVTGTLCFDPTSNSNNGYMWIEPSSTPTEKIFYLVGNSTILFKEAWNTKVDDNQLVRQGDTYTYIKTYSGKTFENNTTIEYKITAGEWGNSEYSCNGGNCSYSIPKGTWDITFTATSSNNGDNITSCQVTHTCPFTGIQLIGDESQLNLGDVEVGQSKTVQIEFEYCGITGINPQFLDVQTGFSGSGSQDSNNRTITYNITFAPTEAGEKTATIHIAYANAGLYQQQITANGIVACEPTATLKSASYNATTKKIDLSGSMDPCNQELYYGFLWRVKGDEWNTNNYISGNGGNNNKSDAPLNFNQSWGGFTDGTTYEFTAYALDATTSTWYYNEEGIEVSTCIDVQTPSVTASATEVCQGGEVTLTLKNQQDDVTYTVNGTEAFTDANEFTATNLQSDITYTIAASSTTACTNDPKQTEVNITVLKPSFSGAYIGFIVPVGSNAASYTACDNVTLQTWIQGATQYTIYENDVEIETGDATGKTTGSNPITYTITGKSAGTYVYKVVYKDACDNTSTTGTITLTVPATIDKPEYTLTKPTKCGNSETQGSLAINQVDGISYTIDDIVRNNLTLEAADHIQPQTYTIKATKTTGSCTRTETTEVTVQTINNTPVVNDIAITTANTTVCAGSELTLQLVGDAQDGVSFQWYKDEDAIVGATSSSLTIQNVTASDAGAYKLVASKTTPCTVTKESNTKTISVDAKSKIEVSAAESFCLGTPVNLASKVTDATGEVTWYTDNTGTQAVNNTNITVSGDITYYAKAQNGVCPATEAVSYAITAKGVTISQDPATVHPYEVTTFTASGNASWEISTNPSSGAALDNNDPVFSGKTTAYITKADDTYTTFKGEAADTGYTISATAEECTTTHTFNVEDDPDNCE